MRKHDWEKIIRQHMHATDACASCRIIYSILHPTRFHVMMDQIAECGKVGLYVILPKPYNKEDVQALRATAHAMGFGYINGSKPA